MVTAFPVPSLDQFLTERRAEANARVPWRAHLLADDWIRVRLGGVDTDLVTRQQAIRTLVQRVGDRTELTAVVSVNLRHLYCFGSARAAARREQRALASGSSAGRVRWLALLGSGLLARRARKLTGREWPTLTAEDVVGPVLDEAERLGLRVGILGGSPQTHQQVQRLLGDRWPSLRVNGCWSPRKATLDDPDAAAGLTGRVRSARVDVLLVCLGKPRQERWIAEHAAASGAHFCLTTGPLLDALSAPSRLSVPGGFSVLDECSVPSDSVPSERGRGTTG